MLSTESLRDQLDQYAAGTLSAAALEEWLASESWDMRRYAPRGLQRLVEALQVALIDYSDRKISDVQLNEILRRRHDQLRQAREVSESIQRLRDQLITAIRESSKQPESIAGSESIIVESQASVV